MTRSQGAPPFKVGNQEAATRRPPGRPKKMTTTIAEVCSEDELRELLRRTYERALAGESTALQWFLSQMPRLDSGYKLPAGLPLLTSLKGCVDALGAVGEMAGDGRITVAEAEKALALVNCLAHARVSILSKASEKLDSELKELLKREDEQKAPPAWSPGTLN